MLKENDPRTGFIEDAEFALIYAKLPAKLQPLILFLYTTGCRLGEALSITWEQVHLEDREIILEASQTKNGYSRTLPLDDELVSTLGKMFQTSGPVFSDCNLRKSWAKAIAGIKPGLLIHDLRRSAVRNLVRSGVSEGIVMKISGHRDRSVFERYNVTSNQDLHEAMAKRGLKCKFDASQAVAV